MKWTHLAVVVVSGFALPTLARAQIVVGPGYGAGAGFSYHGHRFRAFGFAGVYSPRWVFGFPPAPVLPPISPLTPFGFGPGFSGPCWGVGPTYGWNPAWGPGLSLYAAPQPPVIVVPPIILAGGDAPERNAGDAVVIRPDDPPRPEPPKLLRNDDFLVIEPKQPALPPPGKVVPELDRVAKVDRLPRLPPPGLDPFAGPRRMDRDLPDPDPVKELARLVTLGRAAFARGEYGKAGEQFDRAALAGPKSAEPRFLKAQAAFAAGAYADAVAAIRAGLALDPAWPARPFDPKEPYGARAELFAAQLAELRTLTAANPGEGTLEFLLGYQLWFVGEKAEAKKWFASAEKRLAAPEILALFK